MSGFYSIGEFRQVSLLRVRFLFFSKEALYEFGQSGLAFICQEQRHAEGNEDIGDEKEDNFLQRQDAKKEDARVLRRRN